MVLYTRKTWIIKAITNAFQLYQPNAPSNSKATFLNRPLLNQQLVAAINANTPKGAVFHDKFNYEELSHH